MVLKCKAFNKRFFPCSRSETFPCFRFSIFPSARYSQRHKQNTSPLILKQGFI